MGCNNLRYEEWYLPKKDYLRAGRFCSMPTKFNQNLDDTILEFNKLLRLWNTAYFDNFVCNYFYHFNWNFFIS